MDTDTGMVRVLKMTVAVDAGTIINPQAVEGQLEGGLDQGVGYALREEYIHGETKDFVTFKFPTIRGAFDSEIIIRETPRSNGPLGATGVGEMTMVSTAPAVTNAIYNACGARIYSLPATPEKVKAALAAGREVKDQWNLDDLWKSAEKIFQRSTGDGRNAPPYIWTTPARHSRPNRSSRPSTNIIRNIRPVAAKEAATGLPKRSPTGL